MSSIKTIRQWLNTLPEDIRKKALANERLAFDNNIWDEHNAVDLADALKVAFIWENSPEGHKFWIGISNDCKQGHSNPEPGHLYAYPTIEDWVTYAPAGFSLTERDRIIWDMARTTNAMLGITNSEGE